MKHARTLRFGLKFLSLAVLTIIFSYSSHTNKVAISYQQTSSLFTQIFFIPGNSTQDTGFAEVRALLNSSDCYTCHAEYKVLLAPSFSEIALKYKRDSLAIQKLTNKVIAGSSGTWGDRPMPAHPELLRADVHAMIQYILSLNKKKSPAKNSD